MDKKMDVLAKKNAALEESRRKRTASTALKQAPGAPQAQAVSYANVLINKESNDRGNQGIECVKTKWRSKFRVGEECMSSSRLQHRMS